MGTTSVGPVQFRRGTTAEWAAADPILALDEIGEEVCTGNVIKIKRGDGAAHWSTRPYVDHADLSGYVPTSRTVNGKALSTDISLTASDVGAPSGSGTCSNTNTGDQTLNALLPSQTGNTGKVLGTNGTNPSWGTIDLSGYVPTTRTVNGHALGANVTVSATDAGALPISGGTLTGAVTAPQYVTTSSISVPMPTTGMICWLKADAIIGKVDGNTVTTWADSSPGAGFPATAGANAPIYKTPVLNGLPVIRFATNTSMTLPSLSALSAGEVFIVVKAAAASALWSLGSTAGNWYPYSNLSGQVYETFGQASTRFNFAPTMAVNVFRLYNVWSVSTATDCLHANLDTVTQYTANTNTVGFPASPPTLGYNVNSNSYFNGDIAEIIIYNQKLSSADRTTVQNCLQAKYALSYSPSAGPVGAVNTVCNTVYPALDSTKAWVVSKADTTTLILIVDSTNSRIGINIQPTAQLHLAGSDHGYAGTAPLKIAAGVLLSGTEAGAMESDGTHLYWTDSGGTRHTII